MGRAYARGWGLRPFEPRSHEIVQLSRQNLHFVEPWLFRAFLVLSRLERRRCVSLTLAPRLQQCHTVLRQDQ